MNFIKKSFFRLWNSPTVTTWGSFISRSLFAVVILPVVTTKFSAEEISVWLLLNIFVGLQGLADIGFGVTFIRAISYAKGGLTKIKNFKKDTIVENQKTSNWELLDKIYGTASQLFLYVSVFFLLVISIIGYFSLKKPISFTNDEFNAWLSFAIIMAVTFVRINGNKYSVFLQGVNEIPLLRRWETFFSLSSIVVLFVILLFSESILYLIIGQQLFVILTVLRNKILTNKYNHQIIKTFKYKGINKEIFQDLFPAAWRSWIGVIMSYGLIQVSGIIVGQSNNAHVSSSYLFTLKILDIIKNFSNAPFYSKIPLLGKLFAEQNRKQLIKVAERGIKLSLLVFTLSAIGMAFLGNYFLNLINSNVSLSSELIIMFLILAYYVERYGAMHIQFYTLSNNIIWHIANGVSGSVYIILSLVLFRYTSLGVISFPIGMLIGYLVFYSWYSAMHSYKFFNLNFIKFELRTSLIPILLLLIYSIITLLW